MLRLVLYGSDAARESPSGFNRSDKTSQSRQHNDKQGMNIRDPKQCTLQIIKARQTTPPTALAQRKYCKVQTVVNAVDVYGMTK